MKRPGLARAWRRFLAGQAVLLADMMPMQPQAAPGAMGGGAMPPPATTGAMPAPGAPTGMPATPAMPMPMAMMQMPMMQMMMGGQPAPVPLDRVEGRIAFLKAELGITPAQAPSWDQFAQALREGRAHLVEARQALDTAKKAQYSAPDRLQAYEHHLSMRLDSLRAARESFGQLYGLLGATQKQTADELVVPVLVSF